MRATLRFAVLTLSLAVLAPDFAAAQNQPPPPQRGTFTPGELVHEGHRFFGTVSRGLASIVETAVSRWGRVDILVNDAAAYPDGTLLEMPAEDWSRVFAVNVTGTFRLTQEFARHCVVRAARDASVVCITTGSARNPRPARSA